MINVALFGWPIMVIILSRSLPWPNAIIASLIGGFLLLPEQGGLDLPLLPALDKDSIPSLALFALALVLRPGEQSAFSKTKLGYTAAKGWLPRTITGQVLLAVFIIGAFMTALTNSDSLQFPSTSVSIPGLRLYDGFSIVVRSTNVFVPLLLGRKYLSDPKAHRLILVGLVVAGLGYSLLALYEARMSPQLNRMVYGFFPHNWQQHVRGNGFRPLVFLSHGLVLAIFFAMSIIAAFGLTKVDPKRKGLWMMAGTWLLITLVLCNSLGALMIAVVLVPVVLLFRAQMQLLAAGVIAIIVLSYPLLRGADLVPTEQFVSAVRTQNLGRALSLQFRFNQEDQLIVKANERPLFGWGSYGRNRIYDDEGRDQSTVDGAWIVAIGQGGWFRYLGEFGLLAVPLLFLAVRRRYDVDVTTSVLCLVLAGNMIDLIPNGSMTPVTWLIVGALLGRLEFDHTQQTSADLEGSEASGSSLAPKPMSPYTRQSTLHTRNSSDRKK
jgi:hypothetical protein